MTSAQGSDQKQASRLSVMNFLNEIAETYPEAISFASGRPAEAYFDLTRWTQLMPLFVSYFAERQGLTPEKALHLLAQYGRTNGLVNDLIAEQLALDEGIRCTEKQIIVTAGCQEAIDLCISSLCQNSEDVLLVRSPTYIGATGVADLNGIDIVSFAAAAGEAVLGPLRKAISDVEAQGKRPRALYLIPDFDNPTGLTLSREEREEIIALCAAKKIIILEDNPYGMFRYEGERIPTMYSLDTQGTVVYLGTYSKTLCPALRIGYVLVPETLFGASVQSFVDALSQAKSFVTVNTSQVTQAIFGGILLEEKKSLEKHVTGALNHYRKNRDLMLACLSESFAGYGDRISWNRPEGGFFLTITLPFAFSDEEATICARDFGVLVMPLSFFSLGGDASASAIRLAFSNVKPERIAEGIARLSRFIKGRLGSSL